MVETATYINQLDSAQPTGSGANGKKKDGDNHLRLLKSTLQASFPTITGPLTATLASLNTVGITQAAGDNSTNTATTAFVTATSLAATLPGQTNNQGKSITTDGTTATWQFVGLRIASLSGATLNKYNGNGIMANATYTMPDLTTTTENFNLTFIGNAATLPTTVAMSDGWTLTHGISAGTTAILAPFSKATAHGTWGALTMTPPTLATHTGTGAPTLKGSVMMPNGILVIFYYNGTDFKAVAFDTVNNTVGSSVVIRATTNPSFVTCFQDTTNTLVVGYKITSNSFYVSALSLSGTTLIAGTAVQIASAAPEAPLVKCNTGFYVGVANNLAYTIGVNTTVCTVSSASAAIFAGTGIYTAGLRALSTTTALVCGGDGNTGSVSAAGRVITISGTVGAPGTPTLGTKATAATAVMKDTSANSGLAAFDATHFLQFGQADPTTTTSNLYAVTVSGTTVSYGAITTDANNNPATYIPITYDYKPGQQLWEYDATRILIGNKATGPYVVTLSGTTIAVSVAQLSSQTAGTFQRDYAATTYFYTGSTAFDVFTVSGSTLVSSEQITAVPTAYFTSSVNNKVAKYSGSWYTWTVTLTMPCAATKSITISGNNLLLQGSIS